MGRTFSTALAHAGADVVVTELPGRERDAEETAAEVRATGRRALVVSLDVVQISSIRAMVEQVVDEWGHIDILVNNAGINIRQFAVDVTEDAWDRIVSVNQKGVFFCSQAVGRHMIERGQGGKIIKLPRRWDWWVTSSAPSTVRRRRQSSISPAYWRSSGRHTAST